MTKDDEFGSIKSLHLFSALSDDQFAHLMAFSRTFNLDKEQVLFERGSLANYFYYLKSGQIKISRTSAQGSEKVLHIVRPGNLFAEAVAFFEHSKYPASAEAISNSVVLGFDSKIFINYLHSSPQLSMDMLCNLSVKLHQHIIEIENLSLQNSTFRVLNYINSLIDDKNMTSATIVLDSPKHTIASRLSVTPETFSRTLRDLSEKEIIIVEGKTIHVPDIANFKQYIIKS